MQRSSVMYAGPLDNQFVTKLIPLANTQCTLLLSDKMYNTIMKPNDEIGKFDVKDRLDVCLRLGITPKQKCAFLRADANLKHQTSEFLPHNQFTDKVNEKTHADENVVTKRKLDENDVYNAADSTADAKQTQVDK